MLYVSRLGPIIVGKGMTNVYLAMRDGLLLPPLPGMDDEAILQMLATEFGSDIRCCTPELAIAGAMFGYMIAPIPDGLVEPTISAALCASLGLQLYPTITLGTLVLFVKATAAFAEAEPWRYWTNDDVLEVAVMGGRTYEIVIMGAAKQSYGIMLSPTPGALQRCAALNTAGRWSESKRIDFLSVSLEPEPAYAVEACERLTGVPTTPCLMKIEQGKPIPATEDDLLLLSATLLAVAKLSLARHMATAQANVDSKFVEVQVNAPEPSPLGD